MAAQGFADLSSLNGLTQRVYADKLERLWPDGAMLQKEIKFSEAEAIGELYIQGVQLTKSHGFTMAASTATPTLNAARTTKTAQAQVNGFQSFLRDRISTVAASRILQSKNPERALKSGTSTIFETLRLSHIDKLEALFLYGTKGLATIGTPTGNVVPITAAEWAPGMWVGAEDMAVDVYNGSTKIGTRTITSVDFDNKTLTLDSAAGLVSGYTLFYEGGSATTEFAGIDAILTNTGSLFNIDASQYALWKSSQFSAGSAALTFTKLLSVNSRARSRGQKGKIKVLVNPATFVDLVDSIEQKGQFGERYSASKIDVGTESIVVWAPTGQMEIAIHDMVKAGKAYGIMMNTWKRIGSTDTTFDVPGSEGGYWRELQDVGAVECRSFADWAPFCTRPAAQFVVTNIVNTNG